MSLTILIVENQDADAKLIRSVFERGGYTVLRARSAEEALALAVEKQPDVIVTDLDLPGMDGVTMTQMLHRKPETRTIPVIAVTAYPDYFPDTRASKTCFASYVVKPINTRSLAQTVASVCGK
ncbi:two-component system, cell cycle response regulator DivK [Verrucomicrobium sp. GAS474]|uniref:response regulator n=1 Tax=Verrucomicrobium sp. GAS474 TaxID=1882831 RepID=UPI00087CDDE9|nr:response regulator [Verrucomicrobium sp. GAS474]SDT95238.1 two-component system, cell cycle response regulator DivK [Verrucomicrobium sp. GAS474]